MHHHTGCMAHGHGLAYLLPRGSQPVKVQGCTQFYAVCPTFNGTPYTGKVGTTYFYLHSIFILTVRGRTPSIPLQGEEKVSG